MPEKLDPITNLPIEDEVSKQLLQNSLNKSRFSYNVALNIDPSIKKLTEAVNVDDYLEGGDTHYKTFMSEHELSISNLPQLQNIFQSRLDKAVEERTKQLHDEQGYIERALKGGLKFGGKTATNIVGGIIGTVYGLGKAIGTADMSEFYRDNEVFNALDVADAWIDENTVIYGEHGYHGKGFWDKLYTDPTKLFLDDFSNAASFVAATVLTEYATAGLGTLGVAGRVGSVVGKGMRIAKGIDLASDAAKVAANIAKNAKAVNYVEKLKNLGGTSRALLMGSGYEASLEARENYKGVLNRLVEDHTKANGTAPTGADLERYEEAAKSSSLWTFGGNMLLVGSSNLLQFPKLFWKGYNGQKSLWRNLTGTKAKTKFKIREAGDVVSKFDDLAGVRKGLKWGYHALKNPIREGLEELSQGVLNEATMEYYSRKYSADSNKTALGVIDSFGHAIDKMMSGPEGGNAFGMGFLMGMVGLPGFKQKADGSLGFGMGTLGGSFSELSQFKNEIKDLRNQATQINAEGNLNTNLKSVYENYVNNLSIQQEMDDAIASGDIFRYKNLEHDQFYSYIRARQKAGLAETVIADLDNLDQNISLEQFNDDYHIPEVASFTEQGKKDVISKAKEFTQKVIDNAQLVEQALERKGIYNADPELVDQLIHSASVLDNVDQRESELAQTINELSGGSINLADISFKGKVGKQKFTPGKKGKPKLELDQTEYKETTKAAMNQWEENDSVGYTKNKDEVEAAIEDIAKLKSRREEFINYYNYLFTTEGQEQFATAKLEMEKVFQEQFTEDLNKDAAEATNVREEGRAQEQADAVSPEASDKVKKTVNNKKKAKARGAGKVDMKNVASSLRNRYSGKQDLFEKEVNDLNIEMAEDGYRPLPTDLDKFLKAMDAYSYATSGEYYTTILPFYNAINEEASTDEETDYSEESTDPSDSNDQDEVPENEGGQSSSDPDDGGQSIITNRQYELDDKGVVKRDKKGNAIKAANFANMSEEDFSYMNNPNTLAVGDTVSMEIDLADKYSDKVEDIKIKLVKYENGTKYTLGLLSSSTRDPQVADLRQAIVKGLEDSGQVDGIYLFPQDVKVGSKFNGNFLNTTGKKASFESLPNPNDLNSDYRVETSNGQILLGYGNVVNGVAQLTIPNSKTKVPFYNNVTPGAVYMFIKSANGTPIPVRMKTRTINQEETQELVGLISQVLAGDLDIDTYKEVQEKIKAITPIEVERFNATNFKIKRSKLVDGKYKTVTEPPITLEGFLSRKMSEMLKQIPKETLNTGSFNVDSLGSDLRVNLNMQTPITNANFAIDVNSLEEQNFEEVKKEIDPLIEPINVKGKIAPKAKVLPQAANVQKKNVKKPKKRFRRAATSKFSKTDPILWDQKQELGWLQKNLPKVNVKVLEDLYQIHKNGSVDAWGLFANSMIYISENAGAGTAYHEAFHAVFNLMLNNKERSQLLVEAQSRYGLQDDIELEEAMADEFTNYIIAKQAEEEVPYKKSWIGRFFDRLIRLFNFSIPNKLNINSLFEDISKGRFAGIEGSPIKRNVSKFMNDTRFKVPGLNPAEKRERLDMIVHDTISKIENDNNYNSVADVASYVKETYIATMNDMLINPDSYLEYMDQGDVEYITNQYSTVIENFETLFEEALMKLPSYGFNIKHGVKAKAIEDLYEKDGMEEDTIKEGWQESVFEKSTKDTVTNKVKKALSRILNKDEDGDVIPDTIGNDTYVPYDQVFNSLKHELSDYYSYSDMKDAMKEMVPQKPFIQDIINMLDNDSELRSGFFSAMATQTAEFSLLLSTRKSMFTGDRIVTKTEYNIINPNRKSPERSVADTWKSNFELRYNKDTIVEAKPYIKETREAMKSLETNRNRQSLDSSSVASMANGLNNLGITFTPEDINKIVTDKNNQVDFSELRELNNSINVLLNTIERGDNPFEFGTHREGKTIESLAKKYVSTNLEIYEKSFKNVENKVIFSNILPNHTSKLFYKLKKDNETIDWYQKDPFYRRNTWLNELREDSNKDLFSFSYVDGVKDTLKESGVKYSKMSKADITNLKIQMFSNSNNSDVGYYAMPILADAPQQMFIKFKKYNTEQALDALYEVAKQEHIRNEWLSKNPSRIKNFEPRYVYMPFLKGIDVNNKEQTVAAIRENLLKPEVELTIEQLKQFGMLEDNNGKINFRGKNNPIGSTNDGETRQFIDTYIYNTTLANFMSSQIFSGDLAFYKVRDNVEDFAKRNKQIANPGRVLDTTEIGTEYKTLYVTDEELPSINVSKYEKALEGHPEKDSIVANYTKEDAVNGTDAQAYISLDRYRDVLKGMGMWTKKHQEAYPALKTGTGNTEQLGLFLQPLKPFYFGKTMVDGKIVPVQNKNSEYVVLPQMAKGNPKLERMLELFDQGIDSIQFESAVKVGLHNKTTFEDLTLDNAITLYNEDYAIQLEVPEHHVDAENLFGTQIRKLIVADLEENQEHRYKVGDAELTSNDLFSIYQELISTDIEQDTKSLLNQFDNDADLQKILIEEVKSRDLGSEYTKALELDENGNFKYPLFSPMHAKRNESLLNSLFTNRVIKQKLPGASLVQVSDFALSKRLKVVMDGKAVKHVEAILPHYSKKYFTPFMDSGGNIDMQAIEEQAPELLESVAYRIPTEDKYSMLPLKIVGFSPSISGGTIMLPADVTAITGSDFDIDKMFLMFNSFKMVDGKPQYAKYDWTKPVSDQSRASRNNAKMEIIRGILTDPSTFDKWIKPGGFEMIRKERNRIARSRAKAPKLNVGLQSSYLELFNRNMSGKELIGIFANHNANHAILQHTKVEFESPVTFNGTALKSLHSKGEDTRTSRTLAELLAAMVDNAKDPLAGELNINSFTADTVATIVRVGHPLEVALNLINQPVIRELSDKYFNMGGSLYALNSAVTDIETPLRSQAGVGEDQNLGTSNINNSTLRNGLSKNMNNLSKEEALEQLTALHVFMNIRGKGEALNQIIRAFRGDSIGAGPTMSANELFIENYNSIIDSRRFTPGTIEDAFDYYSSMKGFADTIVTANKSLSKFFPWSNYTYSQVREKVKELKGTDLNQEEMEFINYSTLSYITSGFDFFNLTKEDFDTLINKFPEKFAKRVENDSLLKEGLLLTKLIGLDTTKGKKPSLKFNTNSKLSSAQRDQLTEDFEYLLSNEKYVDLANDLIKYSFAVSGLRFTPNSFNNLIPVSILDSIKNSSGITLNEHMQENQYLGDDQIEDFMDKFIRNNYYKFSYLTDIKTGQDSNTTSIKTDKNGLPISVKVNIDENTDITYTNESNQVVYKPYIKYDINDKTYLYKLDDAESGIYNIMVPMGIPNQVSELTQNITEGAFAQENAIKIKTSKGTISYNSNDIPRLKRAMENAGLDSSDYFFSENEVQKDLEMSEKSTTLEEIKTIEEVQDNTTSEIYFEESNYVTGVPTAGQVQINNVTNEIVIFDNNINPVIVGKADPVNGGFTFTEGFDPSSISDKQFKLIKNIC